MADRTSISVVCPGSLQNATVLAVFPATVFGVGNPQNTGGYPISIGAVDRAGKLIPSYPFFLQSGEKRDWYYPPANAYKIIVAGSNLVTGTTTLEFDTPNA